MWKKIVNPLNLEKEHTQPTLSVCSQSWQIPTNSPIHVMVWQQCCQYRVLASFTDWMTHHFGELQQKPTFLQDFRWLLWLPRLSSYVGLSPVKLHLLIVAKHLKQLLNRPLSTDIFYFREGCQAHLWTGWCKYFPANPSHVVPIISSTVSEQ